MTEEPPAGRRFRLIPLICASLTIALGLLTFIGWISGLPLLASVRAKYIPLAPSTALCFSLIIGLIAQIWNTTLRYSTTTFAWWEWKCSIRVEAAGRRRASLFLSSWAKSKISNYFAARCFGFKKPAKRNADIS